MPKSFYLLKIIVFFFQRCIEIWNHSRDPNKEFTQQYQRSRFENSQQKQTDSPYETMLGRVQILRRKQSVSNDRFYGSDRGIRSF